MLANIPKDAKSFLTWLLHAVSNCTGYQKKFSREIFPVTTRNWPQEYGARLVTVTNEPVPRPSTTSFAFSMAKHFFFSTS